MFSEETATRSGQYGSQIVFPRDTVDMFSNRTRLPIVLGVSRRNSVPVETVYVMHTRSLPLFRLVSEIELP